MERRLSSSATASRPARRSSAACRCSMSTRVLVTGLMPFSRGAHVILGTPQGYRGEGVMPRFWEMVERHRINFFSGVPTVYAALLQQPTQGRDIGSLEYGLCGAAPMPVGADAQLPGRTGLKILEGYGLTEGTCVSTVQSAAAANAASARSACACRCRR